MRPARTILLRLAVALAIGGCGASAGYAVQRARGQVGAAVSVSQGRALYAGYCSGCHGKHLEGQALWQVSDDMAHRRAPALDQAGRAWRLSETALLQTVKMGRGAMPAFRNTLDDEAIRSVLAGVESRWPAGLQIEHALLHPNQGMVRQPAETNWHFPGRCAPKH